MSADPATDTGASKGPARRWRSPLLVLGIALPVLLVSLGLTAFLVLSKGAGSDPIDRIQSLRNPPETATTDRERALTAARTFVQRFGTYNASMLDAQGKMPQYAALADLMSPKFAKIFEETITINEQTVAQTKIDSKATVYAVGVSALDRDSASVLVGSTTEFAYPSPEDPTKLVSFPPRGFRYEVSLVRIGGVWKVDDLDDVDDSLPSLGTASDPQTAPLPADPTAPTDPSASPSVSPSTSPAPAPPAQPSQGATP